MHGVGLLIVPSQSLSDGSHVIWVTHAWIITTNHFGLARINGLLIVHSSDVLVVWIKLSFLVVGKGDLTAIRLDL